MLWLLHSREHCPPLPPGSEGSAGISCIRNYALQLKTQALLLSGKELTMPTCKEGELGPLVWDCLKDQENEQS